MWEGLQCVCIVCTCVEYISFGQKSVHIIAVSYDTKGDTQCHIHVHECMKCTGLV